MKIMKKIINICLMSVLAYLIAGCSEDDLRTHYPNSTPVIESAEVVSDKGSDPSIVIYGDSVLLTAVVSDPNTPLSTLEVEIIINDNLATRTEIRTPGNKCAVSEKFQIPFLANAENDTNVEIYLTLTNVEGNTAEMSLTQSVKANRPVIGNRLYLVTQDGTTYNLNRKLGSQIEYQSPKVNLEMTSLKFKIAEKITSEGEIDYSGFVWGDVSGELTTCTEDDAFYEYNDPLIINMTQFKFDIVSFAFDVDANRLNPVKINGRQMSAETLDGVAYLGLSVSYTLGQEVEFSGIDDLQNALNPEFFTYISGNKAKFLGLAGTYKMLYNNTSGFMHIEQSDAVYPDALWICGTNMGFPQAPFKTTTSWNWNKPEDYVFCRKISDGVFQATFYTETFDFKFFRQRMWGDEENSADYVLTPATLIIPGTDDKGALNGNWIAGPNITPGVYRVTINLNDKTTVMEPVN